jgi:uncharacterized protein
MSQAPRRLGPRRLHVRESPLHGFGVFSSVARRPGELLEVSPVLEVAADQLRALRRTSLYGYYFWWPPAGAALALGYGSLYNHAFHATARFDLDPDNRAILFRAIQPISQNQEITINYNGESGNLTPVWFTPVQ